jgi:hypothetical protein
VIGPASGNNGINLVVNAPGKLIQLAGNNAYNGTTTVAAGTLQLATRTNTGNLSETNSLIISGSGAVLQIGEANAANNAYANAINAGINLTLGGTGGGRLLMEEGNVAAAPTSQTFGNLTLGLGASSIIGNATTAANQTATLNFTGGFNTSAGATLVIAQAANFSITGNFATGNGVFTSTSGNNLLYGVLANGTAPTVVPELVLSSNGTLANTSASFWNVNGNTNTNLLWDIQANTTVGTASADALRFAVPLTTNVTLNLNSANFTVNS